MNISLAGGYGTTVMNLMRKAKNLCGTAYNELELPLTLGRDFTGVVVSKGHGVGDHLQLGEEVWGVVPVEQQGCHANYVIVDDSLVRWDLFLKHDKQKSMITLYPYVHFFSFAR